MCHASYLTSNTVLFGACATKPLPLVEGDDVKVFMIIKRLSRAATGRHQLPT
jgi:hypothetical protein